MGSVSKMAFVAPATPQPGMRYLIRTSIHDEYDSPQEIGAIPSEIRPRARLPCIGSVTIVAPATPQLSASAAQRIWNMYDSQDQTFASRVARCGLVLPRAHPGKIGLWRRAASARCRSSPLPGHREIPLLYLSRRRSSSILLRIDQTPERQRSRGICMHQRVL